MDAVELRKLIKSESENIELKPSLSQMKGIVESAAALAGAGGGRIIVGVSDKGKVVGAQIGKDTIETLTNKIRDNTDPVIYPSISVVEEKGKNVIIIEVRESHRKPVLAFNRPFKRVGKSTVRMNRDEYERTILEEHRDKLRFDSETCREATLEDIDKEKVVWFLDERKRKRNVAKPRDDMSFEDLLINIGAAKSFKGNIKPTNAGILFFGKNPQRFFINSGLRIAKFKGTDVTHPVIDRIDCRETLWEMVNTAEEFIRRNIRLLSFRTPTSFQREDKFEYPIDALREAIINALIHRNYLEPADVRTFLFDNHVEIINPGTFPKGVTPKHPIHKPVNPVLCSLMYDIGFIERYGSGIKLMKRLCKEWGNKEPCYDLHPLETKIIFESQIKETTYIEVADISDKLNERQKKALYFAQKKGFITRKEYMGINSVSNKTAYTELKDMAGKGLVTITGKGRGVRYMIKGND